MKRKPTVLLATFVVTMGLLLGAGAEPEAAQIIGTLSDGIWYWDVAESEPTQMWGPTTPNGDIAAGDFTGDGRDDVASIWTSGLYYQDAATLTWSDPIPVDDPDGPDGLPNRLTAGDVTGDGRAEIIGSWSSDGIWYWDVVAENWTQMTKFSTNGDIAAGDFTDDGIADVASIWPEGLWYQDGDSLTWFVVPGSAPDSVTAGDVTGDGRPEIIGAWNNIWYWDVADSGYTKIDTVSPPTGDIAAGDFTGDGIADVAAIYDSGLWYVDGASSTWKEVTRRVPFRLTAGDIKATVTANAGEDQTVQVESADATLDGGASTPEGGTFAWSFDSKPPGSDAVIIRRNEQIAFFEADLEGDYIVELTYTVGEESDTDTMVVTAGPKITARAGELQTVDVGDLVTLDGSGSTPVGGTFLWFLEKPPESNAELTGHNTATPTFTPDVVGHYEGILKYFVGEFFGVDFVDIEAEPILP